MGNLSLSGGSEGVSTFSHDLHEIPGDVTASKIQTADGMGKSETFIYWDNVGNTITNILNQTGGTTRGIKRKNSLDRNKHGGHVESLKHDLSHLFTVSIGVEGSLSQEGGGLLRGNTEFIVECVVPDLLHIIPVGDDTVFNGILEGHDTSLALSFITYIGILLTHADHDTLMTGTTNNGGEDSSGSVITGEAGFDHAGAIVTDKRTLFLVTHDEPCVD